MSLFSKDVSAYVGVDIGSSSIKVVEMRNEKGKARLSTYGFSENKIDANMHGEEASAEGKAKMLKRIMAKAGVTSDRMVTALPTYAVFSSVLTFPARLGKKELPTAIRWEAKKVIPMPIEEMILDWKVLHTEEKEKDKEKKEEIPKSSYEKKLEKKSPKQEFQKILLTGAPKKLVQQYVTVFQYAGLKLISLETESFALVRSLIGNDNNPIMMINFGAGTTTISVVEHGVPMLNRSIDIGGRQITSRLAKNLKVDEARAHSFKQDIGLAGMGGGKNTPQMVIDALEPVLSEIKYTKNTWQGQSEEKITKIIVTGGSANLPGLDQYLSKEMNIKTFLGNPWARVIYPEDLKLVLNEVGSKLAVATGLAMRNIE